MSSREQRMRAEVTALWRELYSSEPPPRIAARELIAQLVQGLPDLGYDRLASRHLAGGQIAWPKPR
jgi:hypothetical protein